MVCLAGCGVEGACVGHRGTSLTKNGGRLGHYSSTMLTALWQSQGGWPVPHERVTLKREAVSSRMVYCHANHTTQRTSRVSLPRNFESYVSKFAPHEARQSQLRESRCILKNGSRSADWSLPPPHRELRSNFWLDRISEPFLGWHQFRMGWDK